MKATVDTIKRPIDRLWIGHIGFRQLGLPRQVFAMPAREIVKNPDRMTFAEQCFNQMRADESGPAGHEKTSHPISLKQLREQFLVTSDTTAQFLVVLPAVGS